MFARSNTAGWPRRIWLTATASAGSTGTAVTSGAVTTTTATDLIFGAGTTTGTFTATTDGSSVRVITSPDADIVADRNVTTIGSYAFAAAQSIPAATDSVAQVVAFRAKAQ